MFHLALNPPVTQEAATVFKADLGWHGCVQSRSGGVLAQQVLDPLNSIAAILYAIAGRLYIQTTVL